MTIEDLSNEIKLYEIFAVEGKDRINVPRGPLPDDVREVVRLGLRFGYLKTDPVHWILGETQNGYSLTHTGKAWLEKRKKGNESGQA